MFQVRFASFVALAALSLVAIPLPAEPCSRIVWSDNGKGVQVFYGRLRGAEAPGATSDFAVPRSGITSCAAKIPDLNR